MTASSGTPRGNRIILDLSVPFKDRAATAVAAWTDSGEDPGELVDGHAFLMLYFWFLKHTHVDWFEHLRKPGEQRFELVDLPNLREYVDASMALIGGDRGWHTMLIDRGYCWSCGRAEQLENMSVCVDCDIYLCWNCITKPSLHAETTGHEVVG